MQAPVFPSSRSIIGAFKTLSLFSLYLLSAFPTAALPTRPLEISINEVTTTTARISWLPSTADGASVTYELQLRTRINGIAQPWAAGMESSEPSKLLSGLSPHMIYEVRVRVV